VAVGAAGADRDRGDASVHGKAGLGAEPGHASGLGDELGRGQRPTAGQAGQGWGLLGDALAQLTVQLADLVGEGLDGGDLGLAGHDLHHGAGVGGGVLTPGGDAAQARTGQPPGGAFQVGVELVQVPAQPVDRPGAFGDQVLAVVDQQPDLPGGLVVLGDREGGFAQGGAGDGEGVDRVGLALDPDRLAGTGHQPRRHPHDPFPGSQQVPFQPAGDMPAVLHRPEPIGPVHPSPADQLAMPQRAGRDGPLVELPAGLVDRDNGVGVLVRIHAQQHHACGLLRVLGDLGRPAGMPQLGRCHAPLKPRRSAHETAVAAQPSQATSTIEGQRVWEPATTAP
jgi:hypothetical protein